MTREFKVGNTRTFRNIIPQGPLNPLSANDHQLALVQIDTNIFVSVLFIDLWFIYRRSHPFGLPHVER